jgi:hypothetical protein
VRTNSWWARRTSSISLQEREPARQHGGLEPFVGMTPLAHDLLERRAVGGVRFSRQIPGGDGEVADRPGAEIWLAFAHISYIAGSGPTL